MILALGNRVLDCLFARFFHHCSYIVFYKSDVATLIDTQRNGLIKDLADLAQVANTHTERVEHAVTGNFGLKLSPLFGSA